MIAGHSRCGFAADQCGKASPYRSAKDVTSGYAAPADSNNGSPNSLGTQRRSRERSIALSVRRSLTALESGRAA
jgi:hypothetical protein